MKIAICDDEKEVREYIAGRINRIDSNVKILHYNLADALLQSEFDADILLLDIQMAGTNGMEAAKRLRSEGSNVVIVFITAVEEYVFDAFDVNAVGFLVKPFDDDKLDEMIIKSINVASKQKKFESIISTYKRETKHIITVKTDAGTTSVNLLDVAFAEIFDRRIVLHLKDRTAIEYYGRMSALENMAGKDFFRPHRSYLINMAYVRSYSANNIVILEYDIPIARGKYKLFVKEYLAFHTRKENL